MKKKTTSKARRAPAFLPPANGSAAWKTLTKTKGHAVIIRRAGGLEWMAYPDRAASPIFRRKPKAEAFCKRLAEINRDVRVVRVEETVRILG